MPHLDTLVPVGSRGASAMRVKWTAIQWPRRGMGPGPFLEILIILTRRVAALLVTVLAIAAAPGVLAQTPKAPVRHVVVFKYKAGATAAQIGEVTTAFRGLAKTIPGIVAFEDGVNDSPEKKNLGFTHVYLVTFESAAARDTYLPHPEHKKFGQLLGKLGILEDAFVVDYSPSGK
jgi:Stress responsive A/B Barrel Domain